MLMDTVTAAFKRRLTRVGHECVAQNLAHEFRVEAERFDAAYVAAQSLDNQRIGSIADAVSLTIEETLDGLGEHPTPQWVREQAEILSRRLGKLDKVKAYIE